MDRVRTNPLHRLYTYLKKQNPNDHPNMVDVLNGSKAKEFFGGPQVIEGSPIPSFTKLLTLFTDCEKCVAAVADEDEDIPISLNSFREALYGAQLHGNWPFSEPAVRKQDMALLRLSADRLNNSWSEELIEEAELDALTTALADLRSRSGEADISPKLKAIILQEITRLIEAIEAYQFIGADGLKTAAAAAFGLIIVEREVFCPAKEEPWVTAFFTAVGRVADVAAVAQMTHEIGLKAADVLKLLVP